MNLKFLIIISNWIKTIDFVIKTIIIRMNKKGLQKFSNIICFFFQNFLSYFNPYADFPNIHVSPEQICCSYHYFLIVLNFLDSHNIICFFFQNFLSYFNPYADFPNIHVSPEQICCSYHYFLIVLNFLDSHHACVFYILYKMLYQFHLCKS